MSIELLDEPPVDDLRPLHPLWRFLRRRDVWASVPAVLTAGLVLAVAWACDRTTSRQLAQAYNRAAGAAFLSGDFTTARVCYERLIELKPSPEIWYWLARTVDGLGDHDRAARLMDRAAPLDLPGYAPVHLQRAVAFLKSGTAADRALAERHLVSAVTVAPHLSVPRGLLGQLYLATGRPALAVRHLLRAVGELPELRMTLARAYQALDQSSTARHEAETALKMWRRRASEHPDEYAARTAWAEAACFLGDYSSAVAAFEQMPGPAGDPRYGRSLAVVYAAWADAVARDRREADLGARVALVERGLRADPSSDRLLELLARFVGEGAPDAEKACQVLRDLLAQGKATSIAHFTLGVNAWMRGALDEARLHLEEADRLAPGSPVVVNNLAWVLAHSEPPDLPRALKLSELAVERQPEMPTFWGTRGVILARLGRWRDALPDLEAALADSPDNVELHQSLASAYESLGDLDMAARHRRAAVPRSPKPAQSSKAPGKPPGAEGAEGVPGTGPAKAKAR
jgi:tetratricopeptide (TPR) repeat protein